MVTNAQLAKLFACAKEAGLTPDQVKEEVHALYSVSSRRDLTPNQYQRYLLLLATRARARAKRGKAPRETTGPEKLDSQRAVRQYVVDRMAAGQGWKGMTKEDGDLAIDLIDTLRGCRQALAVRRSQIDREWEWWVSRYSLALWRLCAMRVLGVGDSQGGHCYLRPGQPEQYFRRVLRNEQSGPARERRLQREQEEKVSKAKQAAVERDSQVDTWLAELSASVTGQCDCIEGRMLYEFTSSVDGKTYTGRAACPFCEAGKEALRAWLLDKREEGYEHHLKAYQTAGLTGEKQ